MGLVYSLPEVDKKHLTFYLVTDGEMGRSRHLRSRYGFSLRTLQNDQRRLFGLVPSLSGSRSSLVYVQNSYTSLSSIPITCGDMQKSHRERLNGSGLDCGTTQWVRTTSKYDTGLNQRPQGKSKTGTFDPSRRFQRTIVDSEQPRWTRLRNSPSHKNKTDDKTITQLPSVISCLARSFLTGEEESTESSPVLLSPVDRKPLRELTGNPLLTFT